MNLIFHIIHITRYNPLQSFIECLLSAVFSGTCMYMYIEVIQPVDMLTHCNILHVTHGYKSLAVHKVI